MEELLNKFMKSIDSKFMTIEEKIESLSNDISELKKNISNLENNQQHLATTNENQSSEFRNHFIKLENTLEQQRESFHKNINKLSIDIDYLSSKTGIHDTKLNNIEKRLEV
ncbi:hypothetical protein FS935_19140 [Metabacillus litoralis]|uniref:Uncharacterized protein n=1 Tax=Metabacillus litoralis TaxID=152268 RepID=A0A5C6VMF9_9BACI|nr:hypothetical protein [Metabacillus litoralis]TXC85944.1 hypothetical protein FS935_19140 [Metabacillus litoralis]